jgi:DDE_Tnp_1-associated/Transposase DDE domain
MDPSLSLAAVFATLPDPRSRRGRRYPLPAVLNLVAVALLSGLRSLEAVAQFGRDHGAALAWALGFPSAATPCKATLSNLLRRLDVAAYEAALTAWVLTRCPDLGPTLAIDGKALRGSATYDAPGVHLLAAYASRVAAVVAQIRVSNKTNEHKAALELLGVLPLAGKVVTGDAMFCHQDVCEKVLEGGGDYVWTVKDNQPRLHFDIACLFAESAAFSPLPAAPL